jgi:oligopeptide transport system substrate-binding protein
LRDDVCWSDGTRLTAHDFEYAWKRVLDPATGSHHTRLLMDIKGAGAWQAGEEHEPDHLGVRALDAVTLEVELEAPTAYFLHQLSHDATFPVPRHAIEKYGPGWATSGNLVANGPFMLAEWRYGQTMHLVRNPKYHLPSTGNVQEVTLLFLPVVGSGELERYEAGDLDVATLRDPPEVDLARRRYSGEYLSFPFLSTLYVGFDVSRPPFDDPQVRHAFILAVDRERLADVHLRGNVFPATGGLLPPGVLGHSPGIGLPYDPEGARQALAEAGYPGGLGFPAVEALAPGLRIDERAEAIQLQAYWHDSLGLEIVWQALELEAWLERLHSDPPHLHMVSWIADYPDPDSFLRTSGFQGRTRWRNDDYDRLVEVARHTAIPADRVKMYHQADRILVEQAPIMPIYYDRGHLLLKPWVRRFPISIMRWFGYWEDAVLEPH